MLRNHHTGALLAHILSVDDEEGDDEGIIHVLINSNPDVVSAFVQASTWKAVFCLHTQKMLHLLTFYHQNSKNEYSFQSKEIWKLFTSAIIESPR